MAKQEIRITLKAYDHRILDVAAGKICETVKRTARAFGIMSIPTLLFKKDGQVVKQVAGVHTAAQIKAIVAELS